MVKTQQPQESHTARNSTIESMSQTSKGISKIKNKIQEYRQNGPILNFHVENVENPAGLAENGSTLEFTDTS